MNTFTWLCILISSVGVSLVFLWSVIDFNRLKNEFWEDDPPR